MRIIIVGAGKCGTYLADVLSGGSNVVRVIEADRGEEPRLRRALPAGSLVMGNGSSPEALERAGDHVLAFTDARGQAGLRRALA